MFVLIYIHVVLFNFYLYTTMTLETAINLIQATLIIILIIVFLCVISQPKPDVPNSLFYRWSDKSDALANMIWSNFGSPSYYDSTKGGCATWLEDTLQSTFLTKVIVCDNDNDRIVLTVSYNNTPITTSGRDIYTAMGLLYVDIMKKENRLNATDADMILAQYDNYQIDKVQYNIHTMELSHALL